MERVEDSGLTLDFHKTLKQDYIRDQILNAGYNHVEFNAHLDTLKPDGGANLDNWTMDELVAVVQNYREEKRKQHNPFNRINYPQFAVQGHVLEDITPVGKENPKDIPKEKPKEIRKEQPKEISRVKREESKDYSKNPFNGYEKPAIKKQQSVTGFYKEVPCKGLVSTELSKAKSKRIHISEYIISPNIRAFLVKGKMFSSSYYAYLIVTKPIKWEVLRRYSDMEWLRSYLVKTYPNFLIPPIPEKGDFNDGGGEKYQVEQRKIFFEKFFNCLLLNPDITRNPVFEGFLRCQDEKEWAAIKKEADRAEAPKNIDQQLRATSTVLLDLSNETSAMMSSFNTFYDDLGSIYEELESLTKQYESDAKRMAKTLFSIGDLYKKLAERATLLNKVSPTENGVNLENIFLMGNNLFTSWGGDTLTSASSVKDKLVNLYRYLEYQYEPIKQSLKVSNKAIKEYNSTKASLDAKKQKKFDEGKPEWGISEEKLAAISKEKADTYKQEVFKLMFPDKTAQEEDLRDKCAYLQGTLHQQLQIILEHTVDVFTSDFTALADGAQKDLHEFSEFWTKFKLTLANRCGKEAGYTLIDRTAYTS